jgi:hypothetical protein
MERAKFIKKLRKLVDESYCESPCSACPLSKDIIETGETSYDICDVLDLIRDELEEIED